MGNQGTIDRNFTVDRRTIDQGFADAGWGLDGGFTDHLVIGHDGDLSILANPRTWDGAYELYDVERHLACWVQEIPTPRLAAVLVEEYGEPPEDVYHVLT